MCRESQRQSKRRNKRKSISTLGSSSSLCWLLWSSGGWCTPGGLGLLVEACACGQDVLVVGTRSKGLAPSPFIPFGCLSHSFPKVLKESVGMGGGEGLGGLTFLPQRQVLNFLA